MKFLITFLSGLIFALGLGLSGMTQPHIVRGFLDFTGDWNPTLVGVMAGAILVHGAAYRLIKKRSSPLLEDSFQLPTRKDIDPKLILGAAIFGIGWGWGGICPGPGIVALVSGGSGFILFVFALMTGILLHQFLQRRFPRFL